MFLRVCGPNKYNLSDNGLCERLLNFVQQIEWTHFDFTDQWSISQPCQCDKTCPNSEQSTAYSTKDPQYLCKMKTLHK